MKTTNYSIENLNNRVNNAWNNMPYADNAQYYNTYKMLFFWWLEEDEDNKLKNLKEARGVDFLDFISATSIVINMIHLGKREFDFDNVSIGNLNTITCEDNKGRVVKASKMYNYVDGVMVQKSNAILREYTLDLIDYIFACLNENNGVYCSFSKY